MCLQHIGWLRPWLFEALPLPPVWLPPSQPDLEPPDEGGDIKEIVPPPQPDHKPPDGGGDIRDKDKIKKVSQSSVLLQGSNPCPLPWVRDPIPAGIVILPPCQPVKAGSAALQRALAPYAQQQVYSIMSSIPL